MTRLMQVCLTVAALATSSLGARAADLVVWWEKGFYPQANEAVRETIAAFEQKTKQVELVQPDQDEVFDRVQTALAAGQPPDFLFSTVGATSGAAQWAYDDRLVDLEDAIGPVLDLFDADAIEVSTLLDGKTGRRGLYALPMGRGSNHVHVWNSLLERAGFTLADIPTEWEAFWSFWCDHVQPAVRKALGRDDIWGVGLSMSAGASDTSDQVIQFQLAYGTTWVGIDRRLQVDDPAVRKGMVKALDAYTAIWRKGCTPPDSVNWTSLGNNKAFLAQTVVMTANTTLSIPAALKRERPDDYRRNAATIDWPAALNGRPLVIYGFVNRAVVFKEGGHGAAAEQFIRFLTQEGWLAHWLDFMGDQFMPPMRKLVDAPFWLDPSDPHRMGAAIQILTHTHFDDLTLGVRDYERQSPRISEENVWAKAVHRVVADGQPRAGGRRGGRPDQADPAGVARGGTRLGSAHSR